jgi:hypothetical protein
MGKYVFKRQYIQNFTLSFFLLEIKQYREWNSMHNYAPKWKSAFTQLQIYYKTYFICV